MATTPKNIKKIVNLVVLFVGLMTSSVALASPVNTTKAVPERRLPAHGVRSVTVREVPPTRPVRNPRPTFMFEVNQNTYAL